jgi:hypothetical protein
MEPIAVEAMIATTENTLFQQSTFNSAAPMFLDAHFITPTDGKVNGQRSIIHHGPVTTAT